MTPRLICVKEKKQSLLFFPKFFLSEKTFLNANLNEIMKIIKYTMIILAGCLWIYSLYAQLGIALNILLGILFIFICFFEKLLWKPIDLIGWTIAETETQGGQK